MKKLFKKSIAVLLSLLVLTATTAISASTHYCGKHLVSFEINKTADSCFGKYSGKKNNKSQFQVSKKSCCKDLSILKKGSNDILKVQTDITFNKQTLDNNFGFTSPTFFKSSFIILIDSYDISDYQFINYQSIEDKTVLFQVFLI